MSPYETEERPSDERPHGAAPPPRSPGWSWAMGCHLAGLAKWTAVPFAGIILPLVLWQMKREESPHVDEHGKEALNFQISVHIYGIVASILILVIVGIVLLPLVMILDIVCSVIAALQANQGKPYRYPMTIRLVK